MGGRGAAPTEDNEETRRLDALVSKLDTLAGKPRKVNCGWGGLCLGRARVRVRVAVRWAWVTYQGMPAGAHHRLQDRLHAPRPPTPLQAQLSPAHEVTKAASPSSSSQLPAESADFEDEIAEEDMEFEESGGSFEADEVGKRP